MSDRSRTVLQLADLFTTAGLLADRDGDGLPETVRGLLMLGEHAALPEQIAAVNLAARLGLETLSLELPLVVIDGSEAGAPAEPADPVQEERIPVHIGRQGTLSQQCPGMLAGLVERCRPGQGVVALSRTPTPAILVGGADDAGLHAAAHALAAGRLGDGEPVRDAPEAMEVAIFSAASPSAGQGECAPETAPLVQNQGTEYDWPRPQSPCTYGTYHATAVAGRANQTEPPEMAPLGSLADLFGPEGLAVDEDGDLLPDRSRTLLVLPADLSPREVRAVVHLGARLGLETLGLTLPIAVDGRGYQGPADEIPVRIEPLDGDERATAGGSIRLHGEAGRQQMIIAGDRDGRAVALEALAHLGVWTPEEAPTPKSLELALGRALALADPGSALYAVPGALASLGPLTASLPDAPLEIVLRVPGSVPVANETIAVLQDRLRRAIPERASSIELRPVNAEIWLDETHSPDWEFEEAWRVVRAEILPRLAAQPGEDDWHIDVRISEPEGRRQALRAAIAAELRAAGRAVPMWRIRVLPTSHQGRAWLLEQILPRLEGLQPAALVVRVRRFAPTAGALELPVRWLQDLFPVDELLAARLDLQASAIRLELVDDLPATYEVEAFDGTGATVLLDAFEVTTVSHPYLARFPAWGTVSPSTGCVRLAIGGEMVVDQHLASDPERLWRVLHDTLLPKVEAPIRERCGEHPRRDQQPFFTELTVEAWLSEDDGALGIREERNSPLEAMHEDVYFGLLDYFTALIAEGEPQPYTPPWLSPGDEQRVRRDARRWTAPGRVVPRIHRRDGMASEIRVRLEAPAPVVSLEWRCGDARGEIPLSAGREVRARIVGLEYPLAGAADTSPSATAVVALDGPQDQRAHAESILKTLGQLRNAGVEPGPGVPTQFGLRLGNGPTGTLLYPPSAAGRQRGGAELDGEEQRPADAAIWNRMPSREEVNRRIRRLGTLSGIHSFVVGHSARGRPIWAMEMTVPRDRGWWSRAKLSGWKCTLLLNGRHHANEPASTTALLQMAELLATDPGWRRFLERVNVVMIPGENADGMDLDDVLVAEHPNWMHHAARYNAAGLEFVSAAGDPTTAHTEALAQPALWRRWAPDIVCDCHGFPSHAWDQPFSGGCNQWFRDNSIPQALIYAIMPTADTPPHRIAATAIGRLLTDVLGGDPEIARWNEVHASQYKKYLSDQYPDQFPAPYSDGLMIHQSFYDPMAGRPGLAGIPGRHPRLTTASLITEVADETAQGAYLELCARSHLLANRALLEYLYAANAPARLRRHSRQAPDGSTTLSIARSRPVSV